MRRLQEGNHIGNSSRVVTGGVNTVGLLQHGNCSREVTVGGYPLGRCSLEKLLLYTDNLSTQCHLLNTS